MRCLSCESSVWEFMGNCWTVPFINDPADDSKQGQHGSGTASHPGKAPSPQHVVPSDAPKPLADNSSENNTQQLKESVKMRIFTYNDLKAATRNFRPDSLLGEGGFGSVFKGWIEENGTAAVRPGTGMVVAVKQLNIEGSQGHREWLAEVNFLGQLHHSNLVKLVGYCSESNQRLLVYEFMARGSLENHLFRRAASPLPWLVRMKVAFGAAKGLAFLHGGASRPVIYRDFKTSNILLDHDFTAKLSDFGLAKDGPVGDDTHVSTRIMGTYGYAAPEYILTGHLTTKNDVYGFGVVLLEMLTGRRCMDSTRPIGEQNLVGWARPYLTEKRKLFKLVDPRLEGQYSVKGLQKSALIAYQCTSRDPRNRPLMHEVVTSLEPLVEMKDFARPLQRPQVAGGSTNKLNQHAGMNRPRP